MRSIDPLATLDAEIRDWVDAERMAPDARLSAQTRSRILGQARRSPVRRARLTALFAPTGRLALAAGLPALVLSISLGMLLIPGAPRKASSDPGITIEATKQGDEVVFLIANGNRTHRVYRSSSPTGQSSGSAYATARGSFRDRLDSGGELLFYRID